MANTLVQFRADESIRFRVIAICEKLGIDLQTYLRMCMARMVQENGIPFSMKLDYPLESEGVSAMKAASRIAEAHGIADMTLEEINAEIAAARQ